MNIPVRVIGSCLIPLLLLTIGCASIVSKSVYPVCINSQPHESDIIITDEGGMTVYKGKTPTTVSLKASAGYFQGKDYTITFTKDGYSKHSIPIKRGVDAWYIAGNILFGGLIGWLIVDPATGAMWTLQEQINVILSPATSAMVPTSGDIQIMVIDDVPQYLRSKLIRIN